MASVLKISSVLCTVLLLLLSSSGNAQNCELYNSEIIERLFIAALEQCHPEIENVTVFEYYINCLSFAQQRDRFTFTTVTVVFNSSLHPGEEIAYHDIGCTERSIWDITPITPFQGVEIGNGNRNNDTTRMDCGACATPRVIPIMDPIIFDNTTHCYECNVACPDDVGQQRCFGLSSIQCCNFYDEGRCVRECGRNQFSEGEDNNYECDCIGGFVEPQCNVCNFTCDNNGTVNDNCTACNCPPQFTGVRCELDFDECVNSPCQNGGICTNTLGSFTCSCPSNFTGRLCETDVNECIIGSPCFNGGSCINTFGGFVCMCQVGFTGDRCQTEIDECASNPCLNGANCTDLVANFTCDCQPNFDGRVCEICTVPNCSMCSRTEAGVCDRCADGFFLRAGVCLTNFQEVCQMQEMGTFDVNTCINQGILQQWNSLITACNFSVELVEVPVNSSASEAAQYNATLSSYIQTRQNWRTAVENEGVVLPVDQGPVQSASLLTEEEWRALLQRWLADFAVWEKAARNLAPTLPIRSNIDITGDPNVVYNNIISVWNDAATDFTQLIARSQCRL